MSLLEELKALGVNVDEGLDRVMGDDSLYEMMLGMFVDAIGSNAISVEEFSGSDLDGLTRKVHTLKGTTGNLSLTPLFDGYMKTLGLLRSNQPAQARAEFERMLPVQEKIIDCIKRSKG
ncbi:MAG: hypothetical protein NC319_04570 [Butyricicoccus sp.]|nr:hypothetical protein [Butyricicoccus sp.]MCM1232978.1 hypothetical protein [Ruminococcus flavefaciens]